METKKVTDTPISKNNFIVIKMSSFMGTSYVQIVILIIHQIKWNLTIC